jgi:hypothetical protein
VLGRGVTGLVGDTVGVGSAVGVVVGAGVIAGSPDAPGTDGVGVQGAVGEATGGVSGGLGDGVADGPRGVTKVPRARPAKASATSQVAGFRAA